MVFYGMFVRHLNVRGFGFLSESNPVDGEGSAQRMGGDDPVEEQKSLRRIAA